MKSFEEIGGQVEGKAVAVIGGGSVAMDCVESAVKLGARDAYLVYRRSFAQMPAEEEERLAALRLGVHFLVLNQPLGYAANAAGELTGVKLVRTELGDPDTSGRRKAAGDQGLRVDAGGPVAVEAIGNRAERSGLVGHGESGPGGSRHHGQENRSTSAKTVFAGGDIARGPGLVVEAVQDGKLAARAIRASLE